MEDKEKFTQGNGIERMEQFWRAPEPPIGIYCILQRIGSSLARTRSVEGSGYLRELVSAAAESSCSQV